MRPRRTTTAITIIIVTVNLKIDFVAVAAMLDRAQHLREKRTISERDGGGGKVGRLICVVGTSAAAEKRSMLRGTPRPPTWFFRFSAARATLATVAGPARASWRALSRRRRVGRSARGRAATDGPWGGAPYSRRPETRPVVSHVRAPDCDEGVPTRSIFGENVPRE